MLPPLIRITQLEKRFPGKGNSGEIKALDSIDLDIAAGEFVCLLGRGKSTLLNAIAGFTTPTSGEITAADRKVTKPGPDRAMVFQEYALFPWMTVFQNVAFGLELAGKQRTEIQGTVEEWLGKLGLRGFAGKFPKDLSGGMLQRVAIARALAIDSPILLMDEPFGALDALTRRGLQDELLRIWTESNKTIVFVTHAIEESVYLADRVVVMSYRPGRIKEIVPISLVRPRDPNSLEFNSIESHLNELVSAEQTRHLRDECAETESRTNL
jgi:NitT/TauT family transport system ATP-binding protein